MWDEDLKFLILSYFDDWEGPKIFLQHPETKYHEELKQIPQLMNLYDKGFFTHSIKGFASANLIFDVPSNYIRGGTELLQITILCKDEFLNTDLSKSLLKWFVDQVNEINDAYKAFYPDLDEKSESTNKFVIPFYADSSKEKKGSRSKLIQVQDLFFNVFYNLPKESITIRRSDSKIFIFGLSKVGKTSIIKVIQGYQNRSTIPTFNVEISQILFNNVSLITYDAPGQTKFQHFWKPYLKNLDGLVFILDITDQSTFPQAREILHSIANKPNLRNLPLLILYNKIDLMTPDVEKINDALSIDEFGERVYKHFLTSALTNEGIVNAFTWLTTNILGRRVLPHEEELGIIFSQWDEIIGLKIITTYPENILDDPEGVALKCFSISQFVFEGEQVKKSAFILPLPQLRAKAAIYFDFVQDTSVRGHRLPLSLILIYQEKIPNSIIDKFNSLIQDKFEFIKKRYVNEENFDKYFIELHGTIRERLNSFKSTVKELRIAELQYKALFKAARDAILIIEQKSGIIIDANEQAENFFLLPLEKIIGSHMTKLKFDIEYDMFREKMANQISLEGTPPFEAIILNSEEFSIPVEINASRIQMGGRNYIQFIIRDVTERNKSGSIIKKNLMFEKTIGAISSRFIDTGDFDKAINETLRDIGILCKANRAFLFTYNKNDKTIHNTHVWIEEGIKAEIQDLHKIPKMILLYWEQIIIDNGYVHITDVSNLKQRDIFLREHFQSLKITSFLIFPIFVRDKLDMMIGFDNVSTPKELKTDDFTLLRVTSNIIGTAMERRLSEDMIKESEEKYRLISENAYDMITILNDRFEYEYINEETFRKVLGYSNEDMIGKSSLLFVHPEDLRRTARKLRVGFKKGVGTDELRFRGKNGDYLWIEVKGSTFTNRNGELKALIISRDISERKKAEERIRDSERKYRHLYENSPNAIVISSKEGIILESNSTTEDIFGYRKSEIIGKTYADLGIFTKEQVGLLRTRFEDMLNGKTPPPLEFQIQKKDGNLAWVYYQSSLIKLYDDFMVEALIQDISQQKIAEQLLKESEEKYRVISETAYDLIGILNSKFKYEYINEQAFKQILGYEKEDLIGKSALKFTHPDDMMETAQALRDGFKEGSGGKELRFKHADGHWVWIEAKGKTFHDINGELKAIIISRDISERKIADQKLKESEERYRLISENPEQNLVMYDMSLTMTYSSPFVYNILGYTSEEIMNMRIDEYCTPSTYKLLLNAFREEFKIERMKDKDLRRIRTIEMEQIHKNGSIVNIEGRYTFLRDKDGKATGILGVARDITKRKQAELKLRETSLNLKERVNELICLFGLSKLFEHPGISINEVFQGTLDLIPSAWQFPEILSAKIIFNNREYKTVNFKETNWKLESSFKINENLLEVEIHYLEEKFFLEEEKSLLYEIGNRLKLFIIQKKAEEKLKASEERYRDLINSISDLLLEVDLKGRITYASPQIYDMFGYTLSEIKNIRINKFIHPDDLPNVLKTMKKGFETKEKTTLESRTRHKDGHYIYTSIKGAVLDNGRFYGVVRDISDVKIAEHKFKSLLETSPIGIIELNLITMKIDYINPKLREAIGINLVELNRKQVFVNNFDLSNNTTIEFKIYKEDGLIWLTGKKILQHNKPNEIKSAIIWITDISDKEKLESNYVAAASSISLR